MSTDGKRAHDGINHALIAAQRAIGTAVTKDETANTGKFAYGYASLGRVLETITPALHENGLVCYQAVELGERGDTVLVTTLAHADSDGQIVSRYPVRCAEPNDPQKVGGAITYARRYSLLAILGLAAEDDDGRQAAQPARARQEPPRRPTAASPARQAPMTELEQTVAGFRERFEAARSKQEVQAVGEAVAKAAIPDGPERDGLVDLYNRRMAGFRATS